MPSDVKIQCAMYTMHNSPMTPSACYTMQSTNMMSVQVQLGVVADHVQLK